MEGEIVGTGEEDLVSEMRGQKAVEQGDSFRDGVLACIAANPGGFTCRCLAASSTALFRPWSSTSAQPGGSVGDLGLAGLFLFWTVFSDFELACLEPEVIGSVGFPEKLLLERGSEGLSRPFCLERGLGVP